MNVVKYPAKAEWKQLLSRPALSVEGLYERVQTVLDTVRKGGDKALKDYEFQFDKVQLDSLAVSQAELDEAAALVPFELRDAIDRAAVNIRKFHQSQLPSLSKVETTPGVTCWQKVVPITKVGLYIPGGTAPLFSTVLMLAIPARTAGCQEIVLCTPPGRDGKVNPAILYAAQVAGVNRFFKLGGSQAIAAMAYGTESVPKVSKIFGPGNPYVTAAKQIVSLKDVAIDMPAGPSEVEVIADAGANPAFVAADLLSQAEHGRDSQVILLTTSAEFIDKVQAEVDRQVALLPRNEIAEASNIGIIIEEELLPIRDDVRGVCDILGFDPLELANEGKFIAFVPEDKVNDVIDVMHKNIYGKNAAVIGEVVDTSHGQVGLKTSIGSIRLVDMPLGAIVPRIC